MRYSIKSDHKILIGFVQWSKMACSSIMVPALEPAAIIRYWLEDRTKWMVTGSNVLPFIRDSRYNWASGVGRPSNWARTISVIITISKINPFDSHSLDRAGNTRVTGNLWRFFLLSFVHRWNPFRLEGISSGGFFFSFTVWNFYEFRNHLFTKIISFNWKILRFLRF